MFWSNFPFLKLSIKSNNFASKKSELLLFLFCLITLIDLLTSPLFTRVIAYLYKNTSWLLIKAFEELKYFTEIKGIIVQF